MGLLALLGLVAIVALLAALFVRDLRSQAARRARGDPRARGGAIEDAIDLHGFAPREIPDAVRAYVEAAAAAGLGEVRLIHGKGKGVQRQRVQETLARHPLVDDFFDAPPGRGAWGATVARLRSERP